MWRPTAHTDEALARFRERRAETGMGPVVCHALYLVNLATPDRAMRKKSETALQATLEVAAAIESEGVVFHLGSHLGSGLGNGIKRVVPILTRLLDRTNDTTWLLLENSAGAGATIGRSLDELATIVDKLGRHRRLGICLDSCHLWVSGVDVTNADALDACVAELDENIGLDRLRALHVNDAAAPLGSNRDHHANVGSGELGRGLGTFLVHPSFQGLPALLETPGSDGHGPDRAEMRRLRDLYGRASRGSATRRAAGRS
jgi:deoxyribonuclease-4